MSTKSHMAKVKSNHDMVPEHCKPVTQATRKTNFLQERQGLLLLFQLKTKWAELDKYEKLLTK